MNLSSRYNNVTVKTNKFKIVLRQIYLVLEVPWSMDPINALILKSFLILAVFSLSSLILSNCRFWRKMKAQIYSSIIIMGKRALFLLQDISIKTCWHSPPSPLLGFAHFVEMLKREHVATMRERGLASKLPQAFSNKPTRGQEIMFYVHICNHSALHICACCLSLI